MNNEYDKEEYIRVVERFIEVGNIGDIMTFKSFLEAKKWMREEGKEINFFEDESE